jgi:hypothetical protein
MITLLIVACIVVFIQLPCIMFQLSTSAIIRWNIGSQSKSGEASPYKQEY